MFRYMARNLGYMFLLHSAFFSPQVGPHECSEGTSRGQGHQCMPATKAQRTCREEVRPTPKSIGGAAF